MARTWRTWPAKPLLCAVPLKMRCPHELEPGRPVLYEQWQIAVLIFVTVARSCKSKSAQWRFIQQHAGELLKTLGTLLCITRMPSRATYMRRHPKVWPVVHKAIEIGGRRALREHAGDANTVAVDKSLIPARGPAWHPRLRQLGKVLPGVDVQAGWGYSPHDGWIHGFGYEVVVCAGKSSRLVIPLLASADAAIKSEHRSFAEKIPRRPVAPRLEALAIQHMRQAAVWTAGPLAAVTIDAAVNAESFVVWTREVLAPCLTPGDVVIMDNLAAHKDPRVATAIATAGARLLYLPPYSPDYNPIENLWSKIKTHLRAAAARTFDTLGVAITEAFESISEQDCIGFFGNAGYIAL